MRKALLAFALLAAALVAPAAVGDSSPLLRCGVVFGSRSVAYEAAARHAGKQALRFGAQAGTPRAGQSKLATTAAAPARQAEALPSPSKASDSRLPPNLTLATFGCAW